MGLIPRNLGSVRDAQLGLTLSGEQMATWAERRAADFKRRGLKPRDRLVLAHGNSIHFYVDLLAAWRVGATVVPVDPQLTDIELTHLLQLTSAHAVIVRSTEVSTRRLSGFEVWTTADLSSQGIGPFSNVTLAQEVAEASEFHLDDIALILFTSGSTQAPKGVVHSFRGLLAKLNIFHSVMRPQDWARTLVILPTHFVYGLMSNSLAPWFQGCDLVVYPSFDLSTLAKLSQIIREERITAFCSVPSMWKPIFQFAAQLDGAPEFRRVHCAAAPLSRELWLQIKAWAPDIEVKNVYGATEMGCAITGPSDGFDFYDGAIGSGWGTQVHVGPSPSMASETGELGEIWLQGPSMMLGYYKRPDLSAEVLVDGWYRTGDLGVKDAFGRVTHRGRVNFVINKAGMKVHPEDVESVLASHPDILDCAALAWTDNMAGEVVAVAVVPRVESIEWQDEDWRRFESWLRQRLAPYKLPSVWIQAKALPRTSRGKLQRAKLVDLFGSASKTTSQRTQRDPPETSE